MTAGLWQFEQLAGRQGYGRIAGVDEAGRGPLAGPVVAAAVILPSGFPDCGVIDSKKLTPRRRSALYTRIYADALGVGIGIVDAIEIDRINILRAALLAMAMAVENLRPPPDFLLVDGPWPVDLPLPQNPIARGDTLSVSIAAASIVAKVTRDRLMDRYDAEFPQFGFARHRGYPTRAHREALRAFSCCPIHRRSFRGVTEAV